MQAEGDVVRLPVAQESPLDFAAFFADEHRELFRLLCFVTGNRADAADLMQDAFLKLWERWDRVEEIADPRAYVFRVALNGSRKRTRAALRATRRLVPTSSCSTCTATTPRRPHASWASVRRPSARSRRRAVPYSRQGGPNA